MDVNDLRSIVTLLAFSTFVGIVLWAYSGRRKEAFEEAARLPFVEDEAFSPKAREASVAVAAQPEGIEGKAS